jgi:PAS domain S-box-containing protein
VSENGTIQLANSAMRHLLGTKGGQKITTLKLYDFLPAEALSNSFSCLGKAIMNTDQVEKCESVLVRLDGKRFPVELVAAYFEWDGKAALLLVIRDITERVQAKQQIEQQLEMLHALFTSGSNS